MAPLDLYSFTCDIPNGMVHSIPRVFIYKKNTPTSSNRPSNIQSRLILKKLDVSFFVNVDLDLPRVLKECPYFP